ncbi:hypothetical protein [Streptosporangium saharense]|uniref:hypothetical protein n=1 Tax=Streptosporangium saharense TaxID=1706840 RepID=UPI003329C39B
MAATLPVPTDNFTRRGQGAGDEAGHAQAVGLLARGPQRDQPLAVEPQDPGDRLDDLA